MTINHEGATPKYLQLAEILAARIESGAIPAGARIPSETEIEAEFDLARGTIRQAIGVLRDRGLIVTVRGKGSFVPEKKDV